MKIKLFHIENFEYQYLDTFKVKSGLFEINPENKIHQTLKDSVKKYREFDFEKSNIDSLESKGIVNTKIIFRRQGFMGYDITLFCKLNFIQEIRLNWIKEKTIYHQYPLATITLLLTFFGTIYGVWKDIFVYPDSSNDKSIQSTSQETKTSNDQKDSPKMNDTLIQKMKHVDTTEIKTTR